MEPARYYYNCHNDAGGRDHVNVHGLNWYLALLHSTLGVQVPLLPEYGDGHPLGVVDFWQGLSDEAWQAFSQPENFGLDFEGVRLLRGRNLAVRKKTPNQLPDGNSTNSPKVLGNMAVDPSGKAACLRKKLAIYLDRFAFFFRRDYFVQRALETLNAEVKTEHAGFRRACDVLFESYRAHHLVEDGEVSFVDYVYKDEYFTELDLDKAAAFLAWLGLVEEDDCVRAMQKPSVVMEVLYCRPPRVLLLLLL